MFLILTNLDLLNLHHWDSQTNQTTFQEHHFSSYLGGFTHWPNVKSMWREKITPKQSLQHSSESLFKENNHIFHCTVPHFIIIKAVLCHSFQGQWLGGSRHLNTYCWMNGSMTTDILERRVQVQRPEGASPVFQHIWSRDQFLICQWSSGCIQITDFTSLFPFCSKLYLQMILHWFRIAKIHQWQCTCHRSS